MNKEYIYQTIIMQCNCFYNINTYSILNTSIYYLIIRMYISKFYKIKYLINDNFIIIVTKMLKNMYLIFNFTNYFVIV